MTSSFKPIPGGPGPQYTYDSHARASSSVTSRISILAPRPDTTATHQIAATITEANLLGNNSKQPNHRRVCVCVWSPLDKTRTSHPTRGRRALPPRGWMGSNPECYCKGLNLQPPMLGLRRPKCRGTPMHTYFMD